MKQQLWVLNSSLLCIFLLVLLANSFLQQTPPPFRIKKVAVEELQKKKATVPQKVEMVYKHDIFETFIESEADPQTPSLVTPVPQLKAVHAPTPPAEPKLSFMEPQGVSVKGIIASSDETRSIAMIADTTGKEKIYYLGDKLKDAQIIKIAKNRITMLRPNGQHDVFYLRKEDNPAIQQKTKFALPLVKKENNTTYQIDFRRFPQEIKSFSNLASQLALITTYQKGKPAGIKVGHVGKKDVGALIGLEQGDVITKINDIEVANGKNRVKLYDTLTKSKKGDTITVVLNRTDKELTLSYKLADVKPPKPKAFTGEGEEPLKLSEQQEREKRLKDFTKKHDPKQNVEVEEIRQRLLENMRARLPHARVR